LRVEHWTFCRRHFASECSMFNFQFSIFNFQWRETLRGQPYYLCPPIIL